MSSDLRLRVHTRIIRTNTKATPRLSVRTPVCHGAREWARDDDGDGIRETHTNTCEGMWAGLRTFLRVFRGVHKRYLSGYVAMHEFRVNRKAVSIPFVADLVALH